MEEALNQFLTKTPLTLREFVVTVPVPASRWRCGRCSAK